MASSESRSLRTGRARRIRCVVGVSWAGLIAVLFLGRGVGARAEPVDEAKARSAHDLVLISVDTLRADRVGAYGDPLARTPHLDAFAAQGVLFREALTPAPLTLPAHASMLTGRYPAGHGLRGNAGFRRDPSAVLLAEELSSRGYRTAAFVGSAVLARSQGLAAGFEVYDDDFGAVGPGDADSGRLAEREASVVVERAIAWWARVQPSSPRFLWVHLFDVHRPYSRGEGEYAASDPYRSEVAAVDAAIGKLLDAIGEGALVVIAGDHGEALWDGGELEHGLLLSRSVTRVPLLVRPPGGVRTERRTKTKPRAAVPRPSSWAPVAGLGPPGLDLAAVPDAPRAALVVDSVVSLVDLLPTFLDYSGSGSGSGDPAREAAAENPARADRRRDTRVVSRPIDGRSLRPAIEGGSLAERPVYSEALYPALHLGWSASYLARSNRRQLRVDPVRKLTDPVSDPWAENALDEEAEALERMIEREARAWEEPESVLPAPMRAQLRALGYASDVGTSPARGVSAPRTADRIPMLHRLHLAQSRMASSPKEARAELNRLVTEAPELLDAWLSLAQLRLDAGEGPLALEALRELLARSPAHAAGVSHAVLLMRSQRDWAGALAVLETAAERRGWTLEWLRMKVDLLAQLRDFESMTRTAVLGLELEPSDVYLRFMAGLGSLQTGNPDAAIDHLRALQTHPRAPAGLDDYLAKAYLARSLVREAREVGEAGE